jgi:hypothetical protein
MRHVYLLSPASTGGLRTAMLVNPQAEFDLAVRLRSGQASVGEVFAFLSGLYFRGKLAYATTYGEALVITAGRGLLPAEATITAATLAAMAQVPIDEREPRYTAPLRRDLRRLVRRLRPCDCVVLLGSIATSKYVQPLSAELGERLHVPAEFAGRGDMSRGGLMLRCVRGGERLTYVPLRDAARHGPRPPKLK